MSSTRKNGFMAGWMAILTVAFHNHAVSGETITSGITYENVARKIGVGLDYAHVSSPEYEIVKEFQTASLSQPLPFNELLEVPQMTGGYPGVALFDYDGDGDLDIYVSNGLGAANSLFQNQLEETGSITFVDVALSAGVAAMNQDSAGVCFGDMDNDGDHDLVVLGRNDVNLLFVNNGNGSFSNVEPSGLEGGFRWSTSCAMGDVNGDGLLDVFVSNTADGTDSRFIFTVPYALNEHNQLFRNNGDMTFTDISAVSGMENTKGVSVEGSPTVTWSCSMVDVDLDGDIDIVFVDDQVGITREVDNGLDTGIIHVMLNNGKGFFQDHPVVLDDERAGQWMGVDFGDLNCDGHLDMFVSNFGDYQISVFGANSTLGQSASRWFLGNGDGTFRDPKVGSLIATPFGWGNAIFDYDNDGDLDIVFHGGLDASTLVAADNPGAVLNNHACSATFTFDAVAIPDDPTCVDAQGQPLPGCTEHIRRNVRGVAVGDLNGDGFVDIVTAANVIHPPSIPLLPALDQYGSDFDRTAFFMAPFVPGPEGLTWTGVNRLEGDLAVEISSGNDNDSVTITAKGSMGLTANARTNRDGIGAVISFYSGESTVMTAVTGGSSHLSQHALSRTFGLGSARKKQNKSNKKQNGGGKLRGRDGARRALESSLSTFEDSGEESSGRMLKGKGTGKGNKKKTATFVDIFWPGGVRNRLYDVKKGTVTFPEIPCSFIDNATFDKKKDFRDCVREALGDLYNANVINGKEKKRFMKSMMRAWDDVQES